MSNILSKTLSLTENEFFKTHINIINALLPNKLSPKEIDTLAVFMSFTGTLAGDKFCTSGKKIAKETLGMSYQQLWNTVNNLKKKGSLVEIDGKLDILPILFPKSRTEQEYAIKLLVHENP